MFHRIRDSIEAHLTTVFAALAVSREAQARTGVSIKRIIQTLRPGGLGSRACRPTEASRDHVRRRTLPDTDPQPAWADHDQADLDETTLVVGAWRFAGMGWLSTGDAALAAASAARARDA